MDPVNVFSLEILEYIWCMLPLNDLLSCMAVCQTWREIISGSIELWRPICYSSTLRDRTWYLTFLEEAKQRFPWKVGLFSEGTTIAGPSKEFCITKRFVFTLGIDNKLCKYNSTGELLKEIEAPVDCLEMCAVIQEVALLCEHTERNVIYIYNEDLVEVARVTTYSKGIISSGGRLWTRAARNCPVTVYYTGDNHHDAHVEQLTSIPFRCNLMPLLGGWCYMLYGEVYVWKGDLRKRIYKCDQTPMSRIFMDMFTDNRDIVVIIDKKIIAGKHTFSTVLVYRNGSRLHRIDIPNRLSHWCFSGEYLVLASNTVISTVQLSTGEIYLGEDKGGVNYTDYIYGVQNIFEDQKTAWIVLDHGAHFVVHDVKNAADLVVVSCERSELLLSVKSDTLVCAESMFVYRLMGKKLVVKKTLVE